MVLNEINIYHHTKYNSNRSKDLENINLKNFNIKINKTSMTMILTYRLFMSRVGTEVNKILD